MRHKIILIILILLLTAGCSAEYTLNLTSNNITETLAISNYNKLSWSSGNPSYEQLIEISSNSSVATNYQDEKPESNIKHPGVTYYLIDKIKTNDNLGLKYVTNFNIRDYSNSTIVFNNTDDFNYSVSKDKITIKSENINLINYPKLELLTIKFETNHNVIYDNADEVKDGIYYWHFNQNNYSTKTIDLEISTDYEEEKLKVLELDEEGYFGKSTLVSIYIIIVIVLGLISMTIYLKVKNSNR